ncbi:MAG: 4-(cytidine 5'-diphospho)-2-C-methyl-D-erythritol kinase [Rhodomicrobium sp.]
MSAALFREQARAKVNLTLHVLGKRPDGYHELESLVVFADLCDELAFVPAPADSLSLQGPFAGAVDGENLVLKAKRIAADWLGRGIFGDFSLQKNIPVAAGLGGGSSDAAAAIRILFRVLGNPAGAEAFIERAAAVGADVPVCLYNRAAWMRGLGERVTPAAHVAALPAILVNPRVKLSTAEVFKRLGAAPYQPGEGVSFPLGDADFKTPESAAACLAHGRNDLEKPATALEPAVERALDALRRQEGCLLARLSGSGPTCFGLFPTQAMAEKAAEEIASTYPSWWVVPVTLS